MIILSILSGLLALAIAILIFPFTGVNIWYVTDFITFIIIIVLPYLILLTRFSVPEIIKSHLLTMKKKSGTIKEYKKAELVFNTLTYLFILSGLFGIVTGFISISIVEVPPEQSGYAIAAIACSALYSILALIFIAIPGKCAIKQKLLDMDNSDITANK